MRFAVVVIAAFALTSCRNAQPEGTPVDGASAPEFTSVVADFGGTAYGEPITLSAITPVSVIIDQPDVFLGERVLVKGMVVAVCESRGCWMDIASDREFEKVQIKVDDGVIVFPLSARGSEALVEGVVEELQLTAEEALEQARHQAEERGEEFDPASAPDGPQTIYRIRGVGALIAG